MEIQIQVTAPDQNTAQRIAQQLVQNRLAACAQVVGPITSIYWWKDQIESSEEYLLLIKTTSDRYKELEKIILELHPYQVPEIIGLEISYGLPAYRNWIRKETNTSDF